MAKAKKPPAPGTPLPEHFHPKDDPHGIIYRNLLGLDAQPDCIRKTVRLWVGASQVEATPAAAKKFRERLDAAIHCAEEQQVGKTSEHTK